MWIVVIFYRRVYFIILLISIFQSLDNKLSHLGNNIKLLKNKMYYIKFYYQILETN